MSSTLVQLTVYSF